MKTVAASLFALLVALAATLAPACGGRSRVMSRLMTLAPTPVPPRPAGMARIVFVGRCGSQDYRIIDGDGTFVGECAGTHWWTLDVPPGEHVFVAWSRMENTTELHASVAADRTYYVYVHYSMGLVAGHTELDALAPRTGEWNHVTEWTSPDTRVEPDVVAGQAGVDDAAGSRERRLAAGHDTWARFSADDRMRHGLLESDGQP